MKIKHRLYLAYLSSTCIVLIFGFFSSQINQQTQVQYQQLIKQTAPVIVALNDIRFNVLQVLSSTSSVGLLRHLQLELNDKQAIQNMNSSESKEQVLAEQGGKKLKLALEQYTTLVNQHFTDEIKLRNQIKLQSDNILRLSKLLFKEPMDHGNHDTTVLLRVQLENAERQFMAIIQQAMDRETEEIELHSEKITNAINHHYQVLIYGVLLILLFGALITLNSARHIAIPVSRLRDAVNRVAQGDLSVQISQQSQDELGELSLAFNKMTKMLEEDMTLLKKQEEKILRQAHFDSLTNLPNRFLILDRLSQLITEASRIDEKVVVMYVDLDNFKRINDTLGHKAGDSVLIEAAERLCNVLSSGYTVGRIGGDEFVILLGGLSNTDEARTIAENILEDFRNVFRVEKREALLTSSIGIAVYPDDCNSASELLFNAETAMCHAQGLGCNTYSYFNKTMNQNVARSLTLEEQMHNALERGEFKVCYQPQVEVESGNIFGVEALLRWSNPILGNVSPVEFIPIAEQTGLIVPIGKFVLSEALSMVSSWQQKFKRPFRIAINLSPSQFRDPNLGAFIKDTMRQSGVSAESLELEITEGVLLSGSAHIKNALSELSDLGVNLAMDDFGTGYSSLSYLRAYPFDILKIDRSFVNDMTTNSADRALVNATIAMAHGLGLKVVAEGVETEEQLALLASQRCDFAQGYLFSKPVSPEEITEILRKEALVLMSTISGNSDHNFMAI